MQIESNDRVETAIQRTFSASHRREFPWLPNSSDALEKFMAHVLMHASQQRLFELPDADAIRAPEIKTLIAQKRAKFKALGVDLSQTNSMEFLDWALHCLRQNRPVYIASRFGRQTLRIHADISTIAYGGEYSAESNVRWNSAIDRFGHRLPFRRSNEAEVLRLQLWYLCFAMLGEEMVFVAA